MINIVLQSIGIKLFMISIVVKCIKIALVQCIGIALHMIINALELYSDSCAMHWNYIADEKPSCTVQFLMISIVVQCIRIKSLMISKVVQSIAIQILITSIDVQCITIISLVIRKVVQRIGITRHMISIILQCIGKCMAYDEYRFATHWNKLLSTF